MIEITKIALNEMELVLTEDKYDVLQYEDFILEHQSAGLSEYTEKNINDNHKKK